jgi:hypothetical protein
MASPMFKTTIYLYNREPALDLESYDFVFSLGTTGGLLAA